MKYLCLFVLVFFSYTGAQEELTAKPTPTAHSSPFNITGIDGVTPTPLGFNQSAISSNNMTSLLNATASYYSPSPTSFIFTHYPTHTSGLNASAASSLRPSISAPLPDDTIGKYGRLHISNAPCEFSVPWKLISLVVLIISLLQS